MKKLFSLFLIAASLFSLASCVGLEEEFLDNSYVYIADGSGNSGVTVLDNKLFNPYTLWVTLSSPKTERDETVYVDYVAIPDGLVEGIDYTIKEESKSPLKFESGNTGAALRIIWQYKTPNEGTLTIKLTNSNLGNLHIGDPKLPSSNNKSTFVFTKKATGN